MRDELLGPDRMRSRGQGRMPPIPLELLAYDLVLGVHPASETSNLKKGVNTYICE